MTTIHSDSFSVTDVGGCLFLKLCGFVDALHAEIRDVSETHLQLRIGSFWNSFLGATEYPVNLEIRFRPVLEETRNPHSLIDVTIRDGRWLRSHERFEAAARRVLWQLKYHLMAV